MQMLKSLKIFKTKNLRRKSWRNSNAILLGEESRDEGSSTCLTGALGTSGLTTEEGRWEREWAGVHLRELRPYAI